MNYKPIIVVAGEPYSIFLEIFFKTVKKNNFKKPIILIVSKKLLLKQMEKLNFHFKIKLHNGLYIFDRFSPKLCYQICVGAKSLSIYVRKCVQ